MIKMNSEAFYFILIYFIFLEFINNIYKLI